MTPIPGAGAAAVVNINRVEKDTGSIAKTFPFCSKRTYYLLAIDSRQPDNVRTCSRVAMRGLRPGCSLAVTKIPGIRNDRRTWRQRCNPFKVESVGCRLGNMDYDRRCACPCTRGYYDTPGPSECVCGLGGNRNLPEKSNEQDTKKKVAVLHRVLEK
jgi:hypothetical protein